MQARTKRYLAGAAFGIGGIAIVGSDVSGQTGLVDLAVTLGGGVLMFLGIVATDLLSAHGCLVDERYVEIHHRSGYLGFVVMGAMLVTTLVIVTSAGLVVPTELVLGVAVVLGLVVYRGSVAWLKRTM